MRIEEGPEFSRQQGTFFTQYLKNGGKNQRNHKNPHQEISTLTKKNKIGILKVIVKLHDRELIFVKVLEKVATPCIKVS